MRGDRRCIGALGPKGESLRLKERDGGWPTVQSRFHVGQVWDVEITRQGVEREPPHTEDVRVLHACLLGREENLAAAILRRVKPWRGSIDLVFDGLVRYTWNGNGYIARRSGVPNYSTGFWIPDRDLILRRDGRHFDYNSHIARGLVYVGEQPPPRRIRAGTLVRVSLATWWRPESAPDAEERCYLQLSHYYR